MKIFVKNLLLNLIRENFRWGKVTLDILQVTKIFPNDFW